MSVGPSSIREKGLKEKLFSKTNPKTTNLLSPTPVLNVDKHD